MGQQWTVVLIQDYTVVLQYMNRCLPCSLFASEWCRFSTIKQ